MALGTLTIDLRADVARLQSDLGKANQQLERFGAQAGNALKGIAAGFAAIGVADFAAGQVEKLRGLLDVADGMNKLSQRTGIATEQLSAYRYAATVARVDQEALTQSIQKLAGRMAEAAGGSEEVQATFAALGVNVTDANGKLRKTEDVLQDVADRFAGFNDGAAKVAISKKLFEEAGERLIPLLNNLRELSKEGAKVGAVFSGDLARKAEQLNEGLARLSAVSEKAKVALLGDLVDPLIKLLDTYNRLKEVGFFEFLFGRGRDVSVTEFNNPVESLIEAQEKLAGLQRQLKAERFGDRDDTLAKIGRFINAEDIALVESGVERQKRKVELLRAEVEKIFSTEAEAANQLPARAKVDAPVVKKTDAKKAEATDAEKRLKQLQDQLSKTNAEGSAVVEVLNEINSGALKLDPGKEASQRGALVGLAVQLDNIRERAKAEKELEESTARRGAALADAIQSVREYVEELDRETRLLGESEEVRQTEVQMLALEKAGLEAGSQAWLAYRQQVSDAIATNAGAKIFKETRTEAEKTATELERLRGLLDRGVLDADAFARRAGELLKVARTTADETSEFFVQAARSIQASLSDGVLAILEGRISDLGKMWKTVLNRMIADAASANLAKALFGNFDKTGQIGGLVGQAFGLIGTQLDPNGLYYTPTGSETAALSAAGFAEGGRPPLGRASWIGENGPELWVPDTAGTVIPVSDLQGGGQGGGGPVVVQNITTPDAGSFRAARSHILADARAGLRNVR